MTLLTVESLKVHGIESDSDSGRSETLLRPSRLLPREYSALRLQRIRGRSNASGDRPTHQGTVQRVRGPSSRGRDPEYFGIRFPRDERYENEIDGRISSSVESPVEQGCQIGYFGRRASIDEPGSGPEEPRRTGKYREVLRSTATPELPRAP